MITSKVHPLKFFIKTYGCQMNEQDSLQMKGLLTRMGFESTTDPFAAGLILLSTCSIRQKAVHKVYSELGKLRLLAEENPDLIVGVSGCVAQQEKEKFFKRYPYLDLVFGPDAIRSLPKMVGQVLEQKKKRNPQHILNTRFNPRQDFEFVNLVVDDEENRVKAFVNIQKGCDNVCAFCIVPHVRGAEVSRPSGQILEEVKALVEMGVKDITLLGQNVNSYGLKHSSEIRFAELINHICAETKIQRLRFTTSHPKDVGDDLIACFAKWEQLCPHFHLPVQSGSNKILQAMRRQYTREDYLSIARRLRKVRPFIALTTDFIVGFPGETTDDFTATLNLLGEVQFDTCYAFNYSPRPHTSALHLGDDVLPAVKKERLRVLLDLQNEIARAKNTKKVGGYEEVLVEKADDAGALWTGRTGQNKIVHLKDLSANKKDLTGQLVDVHIVKANPNSLLGEYNDGSIH